MLDKESLEYSELKNKRTSKKTISILGEEWKVSSGFNLYVDISSACNASCSFCIAPTIERKNGPGFFDGAKFALDLTESIEGTVQIVGGEPMISKKLPKLLQKISEHNYRRVVLNTNGSFITDERISQMNSANVTNVNLSRHHYDEHSNQEIMRLQPKLSNSELALSIENITNSGIDMRMQCNLIKGYIDSVPEILNYLDWCSSIGIKEISFSQIFPLNLFDYQVPIEKGYTEKVQVDLQKLVSKIDTSKEFSSAPGYDRLGEMMSPWGQSVWGSGAKRRFWYGPSETYFSLKTLSGYDITGIPNETTYDKQEDWELKEGNLAFAVLHPNGQVTASWDKRERLLFNPITLGRQTNVLPLSFGRTKNKGCEKSLDLELVTI